MCKLRQMTEHNIFNPLEFIQFVSNLPYSLYIRKATKIEFINDSYNTS